MFMAVITEKKYNFAFLDTRQKTFRKRQSKIYLDANKLLNTDAD